MGDVHKDRKETFKNMTQGQKRHDFVGVEYGVIRHDSLRHPGDISVGQHGPLWRSCGARGIDQDGEIFRSDISHALFK